MPNKIETLSNSNETRSFISSLSGSFEKSGLIKEDIFLIPDRKEENSLSLDENEKGTLLDGLEHYLSIEKQNEDSDKTNLLRGIFDKYSSENDFVLDTNEQQVIFEGLTPYLKEKSKTEVLFNPFLSVEAKKTLKENNNLLRGIFKKFVPNIETSMSSEEFLLMGIVINEKTNITMEVNSKRLEELGVDHNQYKTYENYFRKVQRTDFW